MSDARIDFYTNRRLIPDDARLKFGTGNDAELVWSTADSDNHSLVLALGDSNQALHVTDVGAVATDWNVAADTHPALYLHSKTTPATDYLKIGGHDGMSATIDLVGGTTLKIAFDGSAEIAISAASLSPSSDGGNALGTPSLGWNGLHLNTGTAINWENGDVTLTHAAGKLTLGGSGAVEFDFANHEMTNVDIDSGAIDGTVIGAASAAAGTFTTINGTAFSVSAAGLVFINESANTKMTVGLTLNQGANDDEILAFKSSDVDHAGFGTESDTYAFFKKFSALGGGLSLVAITDGDGGDSRALVMSGYSRDNLDTTKTASGLGAIHLFGGQHGGAGSIANTVADGDIMTLATYIGDAFVTRFIWDAEGSAHADVEWTTFDKYDDFAMISGFEAAMLDQVPVEQRILYEETGIVGRNSWHVERGKLRAMVDTNRLAMLHHGALMQVGARLKAIEEKVGI